MTWARSLKMNTLLNGPTCSKKVQMRFVNLMSMKVQKILLLKIGWKPLLLPVVQIQPLRP